MTVGVGFGVQVGVTVGFGVNVGFGVGLVDGLLEFVGFSVLLGLASQISVVQYE